MDCPGLAALPATLAQQWQQRSDQFYRLAGEDGAAWFDNRSEDAAWMEEVKAVWVCSEFVATACAASPEILAWLFDDGHIGRSFNDDDMQQMLAARLADAESEADLHNVLRQFRSQQMVRIVWRDFSRRAALEETTLDMSRLAEAVLQAALDFLYPRACEELGTPVSKRGKAQQMVVLGMGKLGAYELNVSSDIDLIFAYPESGETVGGKKALSNQEFFVRLSQKLIKAIDMRDANGFVFRVDMRLRPYGQSGPLICNFNSMEDYYQTQGRDWERYAMIKARVVAGDREAGKTLMEILRPFTYRKYIDYSAIQSLRDMKALINREVQRKGMAADVKRGAGGIREVEFIAQAFQIIRGGRDNRFQTPSLFAILDLLDREQMLPPQCADRLKTAYIFLRDVEHRVQAWQDRQTQSLPVDDVGQLRLAYLMGFGSWQAFSEKLSEHRQVIRAEFDNVAALREDKKEQVEVRPPALRVWSLLAEPETALVSLAELGFDQPEVAIASLQELAGSKQVGSLSAEVRVRLDKLMPMLLDRCGEMENAAETLKRTLLLVESVLRRSVYLLLLVENPGAIYSLVKLCSASSWIAEQIALYPVLLDELIDERTLYSLPSRVELEDELRQQLLRVAEDDLEALMDTLRYFRRSHSLRVAACEVEGVMPLMKVSDYLSWLAEAILSQVYSQVWHETVEKYGRPKNALGEEAGMIIVGYGKLGGIELSHGSDLDLVFLHDAVSNGYTDGERSIANSTFFTRLSQRMIHVLNTQTASGYLYEVDMRLRPSGNSGMLVASLAAFEKYQREEAWTWEHQALVRARAVAGNEARIEVFNSIRRDILCQRRNIDQLRADVLKMRRKMSEHLGSKGVGKEGLFDLKQDAGGMVDIEFLVQYVVLASAHQYPEISRWSDNIRILEVLQQTGILAARDVEVLTSAYKDYRSAGHRLQLQQLQGVVDAAEFASERQKVRAIWQSVFGEER